MEPHRFVYLAKNGFLILLRRMFACLGYSIGRFPYAFIIATLIITSLSSGIRYIKFSTRMRDGFTPLDAPSRYETAVFRQFHGTENIQPQRTMMMVLAKDGGSMLRKEYLAAAVNITDYIIHTLTITAEDGRNYTYDEFCDNYCNINFPKQLFKTAYDEYLLALEEDRPLPSGLSIGYPVSTYNGIPLQMERFFYGVQTNVTNSSMSTRNRLREPFTVKLVTGLFFADAKTETENAVLTVWELALFDFVYNRPFEDPLINIEVIGDKMMGKEMIRSGTTLGPYFAIGFVLMVVFVAATILASAAYHQSLDWGKAFVALGTLLSPIFAISTTFGLISYLNFEIYPIVMVIPFLTLAIGVDDAFLMNHAWHRTMESMPDGHKRIPEVMSAVLQDVGPSITITSLTNTLAFGIGSTMSTPIINSFCKATAIAMALDYAYELMLFGSLLAFSGRFEKPRGNYTAANTGVVQCENGSSSVKHKLEQQPSSSSTKPAQRHKRNASTTSRISLPSRPYLQKCGDKMLLGYCRLLTRWWFRLVVFALLCTYWTLAIVGAVRIRPFISSQKILPRNTPLKRPDKLLHEYVWMEYHSLYVFVNSPPDFNDPQQLDRFFDMIGQFEAMECSKGPQATQLWLRDYETFRKLNNDLFSFNGFAQSPSGCAPTNDNQPTDSVYVDGDYSDYVDSGQEDSGTTAVANYFCDLPEFLSDIRYKHWNSFVRYNQTKSGPMLRQFALIMGFKNVSTWVERTLLMAHWREMVEPFHKEFNVTIWQSNTYIYDAILNLKYYAYWTVIYTLLCMLAVCLLFIPSLRGMLVGGLAIVSISSGVIGYLTWWGLDLDPITMSATLMSIGFSVDFTAHVSYHYQRASHDIEPGSNKKSVKVLRLAHTLGSVGWPMVQAGTSTVLCIIPLILHNGYTPSVFVKSIVLVVGWGLLHGLLVLPCALAVLPDCCPTWTSRDRPARSGSLKGANGKTKANTELTLLNGDHEEKTEKRKEHNEHDLDNATVLLKKN